MQSVRAGAVQTDFFMFTFVFWKVDPTTPHLGSILETIFTYNVIFGWKKALQKKTEKKLPRQSQTGTYSNVPGLPGSHPKVKDCLSKKQQSEQETAIWARNKNSCSFLSPFLSYCPEMGCYSFLFDFDSIHFPMIWYDLGKGLANFLMIWHALGKGPAN